MRRRYDDANEGCLFAALALGIGVLSIVAWAVVIWAIIRIILHFT